MKKLIFFTNTNYIYINCVPLHDKERLKFDDMTEQIEILKAYYCNTEPAFIIDLSYI